MNPSSLICPVCATALCLNGKEYRCENGHAFDPAKEGYLNLLLSHQRKSSHPGDDANMIAARRRFFDSGAFNPLIDLLIQSATETKSSWAPLLRGNEVAIPNRRSVFPNHQSPIPNPQSSILDSGCGEGHFLGALSESYDGQFFGIDVSKEAVRCAAKRYKKATWIVANVMRSLPLADDSMDVILSVLAPRNPAEFARVLKPEGLLILGVPGVNHLIELRSQLLANAADFEEKADEAAVKCSPLFTEIHRGLLSYQQTLNATQIADLIQMTPIFWNSSAEAKDRVRQLNELTVTISFALITLRINQTG